MGRQKPRLVFVTPEYEAPGSTFEIQMLGVRRRATVLAEPAYDPTNEAIRADRNRSFGALQCCENVHVQQCGVDVLESRLHIGAER